MGPCPWRLVLLFSTIIVIDAGVPDARNSSPYASVNLGQSASAQLALASRLRLGPTQLHSPTGRKARLKGHSQVNASTAVDLHALAARQLAAGTVTPHASENRLNGAMLGWCATAFDHASKYRVLALERITESGATAETVQAEIARLRNQQAAIDRELAGDAVKQIAWAQSATAKELARSLVESGKQFTAARATYVQWKISMRAISSVDDVASSVCSEQRTFHIQWIPQVIMHSSTHPLVAAFPAQGSERAPPNSTSVDVLPTKVLLRANASVPASYLAASHGSLHVGRDHAWPIDTIVQGVQNVFGSPTPSPSPSPKVSEAEASAKAVKIARENLHSRRDRLEREIAECEGQRAALKTAQESRNNMFARTAMEKIAHARAMVRIQRQLDGMAELCKDLVGDGEAFTNLSEEEKADYSAMSRAQSDKDAASFLDSMHMAWVKWRHSMDSVYDDLRLRCKSIRDLLSTRLVSHQEQSDRLQNTKGQGADSRAAPADPCPPAEELEAEIKDIDIKIAEIERW